MKKTFAFLFAVALSFGMMMTSCSPEVDPVNPGSGTENPDQPGTPDNPSEPSTIEYTNLESNPIVIGEYDEKELNFMGGAAEFMIQNYSLDESFIGLFEKDARVVTTPGQWRPNVVALAEGTMINSGSEWSANSTGEVIFTQIYVPGEYEVWMGKTAYVGISFKNNGNVYYGWVKMNVSNSNGLTFKILGYAYEKTANKGIAAGAVK